MNEDNNNTEAGPDNRVELNLYTEISSGKTFEGKLFNDFVLVRPVLPHLWKNTRKVPIMEFGREFEDFQGNREDVRRFLERSVDFSWKEVTLN